MKPKKPFETMKEIFQKTISPTGNHHKCSISLKALYNSINHEDFTDNFKKIITFFIQLDASYRSDQVKRVQDFVGLFCLSLKQNFEVSENEGGEHPFIDALVTFLLECCTHQDFQIKVNSCGLINTIMDNLATMDLSTEFCDKVEETMHICAHDPKLVVRNLAFMVLYRFQEPTNPDDKVIALFKYLMENDRSPKMRELCVSKIAMRLDVINELLRRLKDTNAIVRMSTYVRLSKVLPKSFKIIHRRTIIRSAISDNHEGIQKFLTSSLIPYWLSIYDDDVLELMKAVMFDGNEEEIVETTQIWRYMLDVIFRAKTLQESIAILNMNETDKVIPLEQLTWENSSYWTFLIKYVCNSESLKHGIDGIRPDLGGFCTYIKSFCNSSEASTETSSEKELILRQLFTISKSCNLEELGGKNIFHKLIRRILKDETLSMETMVVIMQNLEKTIPNVTDRTVFINEIISEILYCDDDYEINVAQHEQQLHSLEEEYKDTENKLLKAIDEHDYKTAEVLQEKKDSLESAIIKMNESKDDVHEEKRTDPPSIIKCLDIASAFLSSPQIRKLVPAIETMKKENIVEYLAVTHPEVQYRAFRAYGLCGFLDKTTAKQGFHLFASVICSPNCTENYPTEMIVTCVKNIIDLVRLYGENIIEALDDNNTSQTQKKSTLYEKISLLSVIECFADLLNSEIDEVQTITAFGLSSWLLNKTIRSSFLIARIILTWYMPDHECEKSDKLKGILSNTICALPSVEQDWFSTIFIIMDEVLLAKTGSPYRAIDLKVVLKYTINIYQTGVDKENYIVDFVKQILYELRKKRHSKRHIILTSLLNMLKIPKTITTFDDLLLIAEEIREAAMNRASINNAIKFSGMLNQLSRNFNETSSDDDKENEEP